MQPRRASPTETDRLNRTNERVNGKWQLCIFRLARKASQNKFSNYLFSYFFRLCAHANVSVCVLVHISLDWQMFAEAEMQYAKLIEMSTICFANFDKMKWTRSDEGERAQTTRTRVHFHRWTGSAVTSKLAMDLIGERHREIKVYLWRFKHKMD